MIKRVLNKASFQVKNVAYLILCRPIIKFACEVWDPYLVRHDTQLENIQRRAVRFIANLRGDESVTVAREKLGLALLSDKRKSARIVLLLKILSSNIHQSLMDQFDAVVSNTHFHNTRPVAHNDPRAFAESNAIYHNSFLPRTSRELRGDFIVAHSLDTCILYSF